MTGRDLIGDSGALFSPCKRYRYRLWREWDASKPTIAFCMLNPSTADQFKNDPTIERCQRRAVMLGYGRLEIVNIFALRSTDPRALYDAADPVGPENDAALVAALRASNIMICGWGKHGALHGRGRVALSVLRDIDPDQVRVLVVNKDGSPKHPLYIPYETQPKEWN